MNQFVHLHLHTEYSIRDSVLRIPALMEKAKAMQFPAVAMSDVNNLFAVIKFYTQALKYRIKPIIGCELSIHADAIAPAGDQCVVLCLNEQGYRNLTRLVSTAYMTEREDAKVAVRREDLEYYNEGLLVLSGALRGALAQALLQDELPRVDRLVKFWTSVFKDRFYVELQYTQRENEHNYVAKAIQLAKRAALPVVASNDVCFLNEEDFNSHEIKVCIAEGRTLNDKYRRRGLYSPKQYLKSADEMAAIFKDIPSAIQNSMEIARRCTLELQLEQTHLPSFPIEAGLSVEDKLKHDAHTGLKDYLDKNVDLDQVAYTERLAAELKVISGMGYEGYFLIVADFILWAKRNNIPVGPGRGSGAGSLVAYALGITEVDPLRYDLLFERFLNPDRISLPDFDIDFCIEGRDRVIQYVVERYGRDNVSQIITFGSLGAKAAIRDVTRVLGYAYGLGDDIVRLIPSRLDIKLGDALEESPELKKRYDNDARVKRVFDNALAIEGLVRNVGQHAGGIVIAPVPLTNYTALYKEADHQNAATHFDMKDIEKVGLVKFDFLGLKTLTIINKTLANLEYRGVSISDISQIPLDDPKTYSLLQNAETTALFQLESDGMRRLIKKLEPDKFEDIVALVALYRPGPLKAGMGDSYANRKHGEEFEYQHPALKPILNTSYGVILYQEQVMQIARVLAGYTLGEADILRRAMGKKIPEEMADQRAIFVEGAMTNGVARGVATRLFDLIEHFAGYGFNKSHSVAYALVAYQTAWLKSNHGGAFMAAVLTSEISDTDKIIDLLSECRSLGLTIVPPDINRSEYEFREIEEGRILYGLGAIRQVGYEMVRTLVEERKAKGDYQSLTDFCHRLVPRLRTNMIEPLISVGAFDKIEPDRASALQSLENVYDLAERTFRDNETGQASIFGETHASYTISAMPDKNTEAISQAQLLEKEKSSLGFYLTAHPVSKCSDKLKNIVDYLSLNDFKQALRTSKHNEREAVWLAGTLDKVEHRVIYRKSSNRQNSASDKQNERRGKSAAFFSLDDGTDRLNLSLFDNDYEKCKDKLSYKGIVVVGVYKAAYDIQNKNDRWRASQIMTVEQAEQSFAKNLSIVWDTGNLDDSSQKEGLVDKLIASMQPFMKPSGGCKVYIIFRNANAQTKMMLPESYKVEPNKQMYESIKNIPGILDLKIEYSPTH